MDAKTSRQEPWAWHPGDAGARGRCRSRPFQLGNEPYLILEYAGDPSDPELDVSLEPLDPRQSSATLELFDAARHGWLVGLSRIPPELRGQRARLEIRDGSSRRWGWLAIRSCGQSQTRLFPRRFDPLLSYSWTILTVMLCSLLAIITGWRRGVLFCWPFVLASVTSLFLRVRTFYHLDDYSLLSRWADGPTLSELLTYNGHFEPLFLVLHYAGSLLAGDSYAFLQLGMLFAHTAVVLLLLVLLREHGIHHLIGAAVAVLYATVWVHVDVVPWMMELSFVLATASSLIALIFAARFARKRARGQLLACLASAGIAAVTFGGGLVAPWLVAAHAFLLTPRQHRAPLLWGGLLLGVATCALAALATEVSTLPSAASPAFLLSSLGYLFAGMFRGSLFTLIGLRVNWPIGALLLAVVCVLLWRAARQHRDLMGGWRTAVFGLLWLASSYALQALVRSDLGTSQASSFRYAYFGMAAAALLLGILIDRSHAVVQRYWPSVRLRAASALALVLLVTVLVGMDARRLMRRIEHHEREYYTVNYQQYVLVRAQMALHAQAHLPLPDGRLPRSTHPAMPHQKFVPIAAFLGDRNLPEPRHEPSEEAQKAQGFLPLLRDRPRGKD